VIVWLSPLDVSTYSASGRDVVMFGGALPSPRRPE
jgi:hypothetical protein